jgi:rod shape-determining protein MreB
MGLFDVWTETIGIDAGTHQLRIIKGDKLIFNERAQISIDTVQNKLSGFGDNIRTGASDVTINPINYTICDFHAFEMLLRSALKKSIDSRSFLPKALITYLCMPNNATEIDRRAYRDSTDHANAKEVYMIHQSSCAAIGLNVLERKNFAIIDFGASKIETSVFSDGKLVWVGIFRMGLWDLFRLLRNYAFRQHNIILSDVEITTLLHSMNDVHKSGQLAVQQTYLPTLEINDVLDKFFYLANNDIQEAFERVSNDRNIQQIYSNGVYFTGGGSALPYLRKLIKLDNPLKVTVSPTPLLDNSNGLKAIMKNKAKYKNYIMT